MGGSQFAFLDHLHAEGGRFLRGDFASNGDVRRNCGIVLAHKGENGRLDRFVGDCRLGRFGRTLFVACVKFGDGVKGKSLDFVSNGRGGDGREELALSHRRPLSPTLGSRQPKFGWRELLSLSLCGYIIPRFYIFVKGFSKTF